VWRKGIRGGKKKDISGKTQRGPDHEFSEKEAEKHGHKTRVETGERAKKKKRS